jgi:hypothetical protein
MNTSSTISSHLLFLLVRNCRVENKVERVNEFCRDAKLQLDRIAMSKQEKGRLASKLADAIKAVKALKINTLPKRVAAVIALDDLYNWLYYATNLSSGNNLPTPAEYYSIYAFDPTQPSLESFWTKYGHGDEMCADISTLNPNPLYVLYRSRWLETFSLFSESGLKVVAGDCRPSGMGSTLKGDDPLCPMLLNSWRDSIRNFACFCYAFAVPNEQALSAIGRFAPVIEIGAGTGYWASLLRARGVDVIALDIDPPSSTRPNEYHGHCGTHTKVERGNPASLTKIGTSEHSLFLCYPPPDSSMAFDALNAFRGSTVIHVGEFNGDTGTAAFHSRLERDFVLIERIYLPNFGNTCYDLTIWQKRGVGIDSLTLPPSITSCTVCGGVDLPLRRCRFTCAVQFCGELCRLAGEDGHSKELQKRHLLLDAKSLSFEISSFRVLSSGVASSRKRKRDDRGKRTERDE